MNNLDNFRKIADDIMKDIKVHDELRNKTLAKCKKKAGFKGGFASSTAVAALLLIAIPALLLFGRGRNLNNPMPMMEASGGKNVILSNNEGKTNSKDNPDKAVSNEGTLFTLPKGSGDIDSCEPYKGSGEILYRPGTEGEAGKYMGEAFKKPQYVPSGFTQSLIQVPVDMKRSGMDIILGYEGENKIFSIIMRMGVSSLEGFSGEKDVDINGTIAQLSTSKLMAGSIELASDYTQIRWINNNVLYIIEGQISEKEAVRVARSIK